QVGDVVALAVAVLAVAVATEPHPLEPRVIGLLAQYRIVHQLLETGQCRLVGGSERGEAEQQGKQGFSHEDLGWWMRAQPDGGETIGTDPTDDPTQINETPRAVRVEDCARYVSHR